MASIANLTSFVVEYRFRKMLSSIDPDNRNEPTRYNEWTRTNAALFASDAEEAKSKILREKSSYSCEVEILNVWKQ